MRPTIHATVIVGRFFMLELFPYVAAVVGVFCAGFALGSRWRAAQARRMTPADLHMTAIVERAKLMRCDPDPLSPEDEDASLFEAMASAYEHARFPE